MKRKPLVSIVILNYNGKEFVDRCLHSVLNTDYPNFEVIFVDNASTDRSLEHAKKKFGHDPRLKFVANDKNYGFAGGNNIGLDHACGEYIVFLNNDTQVDSNWLSELIQVMDSDSSIGAAQSKLLMMHDPKRIDACGLMLTPYGILLERGSGEVDSGQYDETAEIFAAKGAAIAVKREVLNEVGPFDKDYFVFSEDVDLCWRIWLRGYRVVLVPKSIVFHEMAGTLSQLQSRPRPYWDKWYKNTLVTFLKNLSLKYLARIFLAFVLVTLGGLIKNKALGHLPLFFRANVEIMANFRSIWKKRMWVQYKIRKKKDEEILPRLMYRIPLIG
ncbi:MAG: glycosyltransferase family 2 protein [Candidatus Hadarchaeales archaeon]